MPCSCCGAGDARRPGRPGVQGGALVRVLPVAQHLPPGPERGDDVRPAGLGGGVVRRVDRGEPGGDGGVVAGRVRVGAGREAAAPRQREPAAGDRLGHLRVHRRIGDDGDAGVVLGRGAHHGRAADIDLLHALLRRGTAGGGLLERVQVGHEQLERGDARVRASCSRCAGCRTSASSPACTAGCRVLTRPSRHSGKPVRSSTLVTGTPAARDRRRGAAGADDLHPGSGQCLRQPGQPGLVVDADQRPPDGNFRQRPTFTFCQRPTFTFVNARPSPSGPGRTIRRGPSRPRCPPAAPARPP